MEQFGPCHQGICLFHPSHQLFNDYPHSFWDKASICKCKDNLTVKFPTYKGIIEDEISSSPDFELTKQKGHMTNMKNESRKSFFDLDLHHSILHFSFFFFFARLSFSQNHSCFFALQISFYSCCRIFTVYVLFDNNVLSNVLLKITEFVEFSSVQKLEMKSRKEFSTIWGLIYLIFSSFNSFSSQFRKISKDVLGFETK